MTQIAVDHLASRWDRSVKSLWDDIERSDLMNADVISVTEVADGKRHRALKRDGWATCQDRQPWQSGEVAIMVRDSFGSVLEWETVQIGPDLGPGNAVYAIIAIIGIHNTGEVLLVADSHLPSAVEKAWGKKRGREYRKMVRNYRSAVRRYMRKYNPDAAVVWADWNLNLNLAWVRDWVVGVWTKGKVLGKKKTPAKGTHGNRLIDWPVTHGLRKRRLRVLDMTPGSDHRGARLIGRILKRR